MFFAAYATETVSSRNSATPIPKDIYHLVLPVRDAES